MRDADKAILREDDEILKALEIELTGA